MPIKRTQAIALAGTGGHLVTIEVNITAGLPATILNGLPDTVLRETRDRIRAAIINSGERWPDREITITLSPISLSTRSGTFDLAIAIAILAANGDLPELPDKLAFLSELGLDGRLRPIPGVLAAVLSAADSELSTVVVADNHAEASLAPGVTVIAADKLADIVVWLRDEPRTEPRIT
jgi:magnesium chelatase family protein